MNLKHLLFFPLLIALSYTSFGQESAKETGSLLVMGGNCTNDYFLTVFSGLAGGLESSIILIPTAMEDKLLDSDFDLEMIKKPFTDFGFKNIQIVHTRNKEIANSDSLNALILQADGIWITGGRQWRLAEVYNGTTIIQSLETVLAQGGTIAGTSAGASIMGSLLVRGDSLDHTIMMGSHPTGFGFMKNCAIDQHHLARNRQFDMFEIKRTYPEILGIGIEENTGIIVNEEKFKVVGQGYVSIYDGTRWSAERDTIYALPLEVEQFYLLEPDLEYDLVKRKVIFPEDRSNKDCSPQLLKSLTGTYQQVEGIAVGNDIRIDVTVENGKLYFEQSWNKAKYEVHYDHSLTFFRPHANAVFYFEKDKFGLIDAFKFYQHGSTKWKKI